LPVPPFLANAADTLAPWLFTLLAAFALQLYALALVSGTPTLQAVGRFVRNVPGLSLSWLKDLAAIRQW
jgi:hypothetical protein